MVELPLEFNPTPSPDYSIILLHGLGANGNDLFPLAPVLANGRCRVICPHAPTLPVTLNGGMVMPAWYDIIGADLSDRQDTEGVEKSSEIIQALIQAEIDSGFTPDKIFLAGFSQGAAMALHIGLRYKKQLAGIIALSGYLLFSEQPLPRHNQLVPIFQAHGSFDPVVLPQWAKSTKNILQENNFMVEYHEYNMMHNISQDTINDINQWLLPIISPQG